MVIVLLLQIRSVVVKSSMIKLWNIKRKCMNGLQEKITLDELPNKIGGYFFLQNIFKIFK
jgi:hypothetical protein